MLFRIGTAARLSGIEIATLRNWERRYGLVAADRGPRKQPVYSSEDVDRLPELKQLVTAGYPAGEPHRLLRQRLAGRGDRAADSIRDDARRLRAEVAESHARAAAAHQRAAERLATRAAATNGNHAAVLRRLAAAERRRRDRKLALEAASRGRG